MLCGRYQARYDTGAWYLLPCSVLLCPVGGLGRAPFSHVFVAATVLGCNSNCCTCACAGQLSWQGCLLGWCWFASDICYCWYQPWLYFKKSRRLRARAAMHGVELETPVSHIVELYWGWGGALSQLRGSVWPSRITVTAASRIQTYAGRSHLISSQTP